MDKRISNSYQNSLSDVVLTMKPSVWSYYSNMGINKKLSDVMDNESIVYENTELHEEISITDEENVVFIRESLLVNEFAEEVSSSMRGLTDDENEILEDVFFDGAKKIGINIIDLI